MSEQKPDSWFRRLRKPSPSHSVLTLLAIGLVLGVATVVAFDATIEFMSSEKYCTSCHEMKIPYAQLQQTHHFSNSQGVSATCVDCHLPNEFGPKMYRKIEASREVWGWMIGIIDTPEKYEAHRPVMKEREIARLRARNSQECRDCHSPERMRVELQSKMAQRFHQPARMEGKSCIDCHAGIAHPRG